MAAPPPELRYPRLVDGDGDNLLVAWMGRRGGLRQQLLDYGRAYMLLGALVVLTWHRLAGCNCNPDHVLAGFLLWLLGVALTALSHVAGQFPRLAAAAAALARALRNYLLGAGAGL